MSTGRGNDMGMGQWQRQSPPCPPDTYIQARPPFDAHWTLVGYSGSNCAV